MEKLLLFFVILICVFAIGNIFIIKMYYTWFPKTNLLRINTKQIGKLTFYRAEIYRPIFGWTAFNASKYTGEIWQDKKWINRINDCQDNINVYKQLKNIE